MAQNNHNVSLPQWLTKDYFENILKKVKNAKNLKITNFEMEPAIPKGENFASILTRVKLTYAIDTGTKSDTTQVNYIIKTQPVGDPEVAAFYAPYQLFETEMAMYENVLPKLSDLLHKIGDKDKLFADTIHVDNDNEAIIFEDLAVNNFRLADRLKGLNMEHAKFALKKLAKMHATAAVLNEQTKGSLEHFTRGILNRHTRNLACVYEYIIEVCAEFAGDCPELGLYYKEKLMKLKAHIVEYGTRCFDLHAGQFHTLNHGDFWVNNIMIRYGGEDGDESKIEDLILIDFQLCSWTSPAIDLHYFFNTSLENQLRLHNEDELVQYYHGILKATLVALGYSGQIPSLHEFCVQMEMHRFFAVATALVAQAFQLNNSTEATDAGALLLDNERGRNFRRKLYNNKVIQENVKQLLPFYDRRGLLDVYD